MRSSSYVTSTGQVEVGTADLQRAERKPAGNIDFAADAIASGCSYANTNGAPGPEHAVHLTEQAVEVLDLGEQAGH